MVCPNCGKKNKKGNQFCSKCGRPLPPEAPPFQPASPKARSNKPLVIVIAILAILLVAAAVVVTLVLTRKAPAAPAVTSTSTSESIITQAPVQPVVTQAAAATQPPIKLPPTNRTPQVMPTRQYSPPSAPISQTGPWLIYLKSDGLYAANADGSGVNKIYPAPFPNAMIKCLDLPYGIAPTGDKIAIRYSVDNPRDVGWNLAILHLPSLEVEYVSPLLAGEILNGVTISTDLDPQVIQAIQDNYALAWSPDGHYLAFVAALNGPSSDLYLYSTFDGSVKRLTSGSLEVASPLFTPNGSEIIYQVVESFGVGAGGSVASIRAVTPDGTTDRLILNIPDNVGPITVLKITNDEYLVMNYFSQSNPQLRVVDLHWAFENELSVGSIYAADVDPVTGAISFIDQNGFLFFVSDPEGLPSQVSNDDWSASVIQWNPAYQTFEIYGSNGWYELDPDGSLHELSDTNLIVYISPNNQAGCFSEINELWCFTMERNYSIAEGSKLIMTWASDSSGFFFINENNDLYYVSASDFTPSLMDTGIFPVGHVLIPFYLNTLDLDMLGWIGQ